jgi:hypothetical protein
MQARQAAASQADDPTWLADTVYGDPRAAISRDDERALAKDAVKVTDQGVPVDTLIDVVKDSIRRAGVSRPSRTRSPRSATS